MAMDGQPVTLVGMKPLSERDENPSRSNVPLINFITCRNEATL